MVKPVISLPPSRSATNRSMGGKPVVVSTSLSKKTLASSGSIQKAKARSVVAGSSSSMTITRKAATFPRPSTSSAPAFLTQDRLLKDKAQGEGRNVAQGGGVRYKKIEGQLIGNGGAGETKRIIKKAIDEAISRSITAHRRQQQQQQQQRKSMSAPAGSFSRTSPILSTPTTKVFSAVNRRRA